MKKIVVFLVLFINCILLLQAEGLQSAEKRTVLLLPTQDATNNEKYKHLRKYIFNILKINLQKYKNLQVIIPEQKVSVDLYTGDFESYVRTLSEHYTSAESFIFGEYFVDGRGLHVFVNVWDAASLRVKNLFVKTMPADLDMLENIDRMCIDIAGAVAKDLPPLERDILFQKQVLSGLRRQINYEEKLIEDISAKHNEIQVTPMTGLSLGRTIISWSDLGPFIAPLLYLEYTRYLTKDLHARFGFEYLPMDLLTQNSQRYEISLQALIGFHTQSLFSFTVDAGLALIYDYNQRSAALAYTGGSDVVYPKAERFSVSIPLEVGCSIFLNDLFFINLRFRYHGLTYTFEPKAPGDYDEGNSSYLYSNGFSPWNLLCLSISTQIGFRF
ncbi:MAG: hypothetical protein P8107_06890 [Spirochaetia bacterium]